MQRRLILLGAVEQALGGDAALIQARAAEGALFDQRRAQARLSRALRTKKTWLFSQLIALDELASITVCGVTYPILQ